MAQCALLRCGRIYYRVCVYGPKLFHSCVDNVGEIKDSSFSGRFHLKEKEKSIEKIHSNQLPLIEKQLEMQLKIKIYWFCWKITVVGVQSLMMTVWGWLHARSRLVLMRRQQSEVSRRGSEGGAGQPHHSRTWQQDAHTHTHTPASYENCTVDVSIEFKGINILFVFYWQKSNRNSTVYRNT